jgi:hypothetical protein
MSREGRVTAEELLLPTGSRLLHIGPHKTGTTAVQGAFHLARERLAAQGVLYAGGARQPLRAAIAVTGRPPLLGGPPPSLARWDSLVSEVTGAGDQRVVVSSEFFSEATAAAARNIVESLGGPQVHVVVTLRPLAKILPSQWQQYLQNGYRTPYLEWLEGILADPPRTSTPGFWDRHRHDRLISKWADVTGTQNLSVVVVNEADRKMLLSTFEQLTGLPDGFLIPDEEIANRSLTLAEAEVVRLLNEEFKRSEWPDAHYSRFMRYGAVEQMKAGRLPLPGEPKIVTPAWALKRAAEIGTEMAQHISGLGVRIIGDISSLGEVSYNSPDDAAAASGAAPLLLPVEAAAQAVVGALMAGRVAGQTPMEAAPDVDAATMARELVRRTGRRLGKLGRRTPEPDRPDDSANSLMNRWG